MLACSQVPGLLSCTRVTFFPSGMNCGKYSAQLDDVCSFDYSTSVRLIETDTDKAFQFLYCLLHG